ncbi:MAG: hypothetical protein R3E94_11000, partial [Burkholderiaceae bacterium]
PDELKRQYNEKTRTEARTFETQGVSRQAALDYLETPEGRLYRQRLIEGAPDKPVSEIRRWAINQITSGRELPRMETLTEPLVKIVPQGQRPSPHSPYWTREADLDAAIKEGQNLSHRFGLPVASESLQYDVYRITPKRPTEVFVNTVAPTSELDGQVTKPGGARQVLIPNRQLYEPHAFIRTVDNRLHIPAKGHGIRPTVKAAGALGTAYGAYDAKHQVDAAIDTARSSREQWVRGAEEVANQTVRTVVTGSAATVGSIPGAAGGALTSPVTGPLGPMAGGLLTGGAAAAGAENLYEDSRLQQWSKTLGREVGQMGYDHVSREGRLLRQVNGLQEDLLNTTDPIERGRLQTRLDAASAAFGQEAERNSRTFEARAEIDQAWERNHARYPQIDKDDVNDALARHIGAGKPPADAVRGAFSDAVHERYPRSLPHEPLENYRALGDAQLAQKHQQYVGEVAQGRRDVMVLAASKDSHNNIDQGWPQALAQQRQAERVQAGMNGLWRDIGHLGAIREVYRERGLRPPELPAELRAREDTAAPTRSGRSALTPEQQRHHALAREQLAPGLTAQGHGPENMDRVCAAAVSHAQRHAHRGQVRAFHLSKDGRQIAVVQERAPIGEFSVHHALAQTSDWHLAQAHEMAQAAAKNLANAAVQTQAGAPSGPTPTRASVWA